MYSTFSHEHQTNMHLLQFSAVLGMLYIYTFSALSLEGNPSTSPSKKTKVLLPLITSSLWLKGSQTSPIPTVSSNFRASGSGSLVVVLGSNYLRWVPNPPLKPTVINGDRMISSQNVKEISVGFHMNLYQKIIYQVCAQAFISRVD